MFTRVSLQNDINNIFQKYNNAEFMIHPECGCISSTLYGLASGDITRKGHILSTEGMMQHAKNQRVVNLLLQQKQGS